MEQSELEGVDIDRLTEGEAKKALKGLRNAFDHLAKDHARLKAKIGRLETAAKAAGGQGGSSPTVETPEGPVLDTRSSGGSSSAEQTPFVSTDETQREQREFDETQSEPQNEARERDAGGRFT